MVGAAATLRGRIAAMTTTGRVFELRTYHATPGKLDALLARFRDHTHRIFVRHGIEVVGYWVPVPADGAEADTLVYVVVFDDDATRTAAWQAFRDDAEWASVRAESERVSGGPLVTGIDVVTLAPTNFSPLR